MINTTNARMTDEIIRWIKLLALPKWAKLCVILALTLMLSSATFLIVRGIIDLDKDTTIAGVGLLTFGLPLALITIATFFEDGGTTRLTELTRKLLEQELPKALDQYLHARPLNTRDFKPAITHQVRGCVGDYKVHVSSTEDGKPILHFLVELNVHKVNIVVLLPDKPNLNDSKDYFKESILLESCLHGATNEGYQLNPKPEERENNVGLVLTKTFSEDFLLNPLQRLYFAQDLSFFIRGMIDALRKK